MIGGFKRQEGLKVESEREQKLYLRLSDGENASFFTCCSFLLSFFCTDGEDECFFIAECDYGV